MGTDLLTGKQVPVKVQNSANNMVNSADNHEDKLYLGNDRASVVRQQKFLKSLGYNVTPDGSRGKFTNSAWQSYKNGFGPSRWNQFITNHFTDKPSATPTAPHDPAPSVVPPASTPAPRSTAAAGKGGKDTALAQLLASLDGGSNLDPSAYAHSAVNAEYDPQIAELANANSLAGRQGAQDQTDLQNWYAQLMSQAQGAATANTDALKSALGGQDAAAQGAVAALGGGAAAGDAAAWSQIARSKLAGLGLSQAGFDNNIQPALALQGVDARVRDKNATQSAQQDLAVKLAALKGAKGQAYGKALYEATDQANSRSIANINAKAQLAMLPGQLEGQQIDLAGKTTDLARAKIQYDSDALALQQAKLTAQNGGAIPNFGRLDPENLRGLANQLTSAVTQKKNPKALGIDPAIVFNSWGNELRTYSNGKWDPHSNPQLNAWRNGLLEQFLPSWNAAHPKRQYVLKKGQLYRNGKQVSNV